MRTKSQVKHVLQKMTQQIIEGYQPQKIILYGSLAYGDIHEDSDIDLLIIKETRESPLDRRVRVRQLVSNPKRNIPFSPLVVTPQELHQRLALNDPFYREILDRGKILYVQN